VTSYLPPIWSPLRSLEEKKRKFKWWKCEARCHTRLQIWSLCAWLLYCIYAEV